MRLFLNSGQERRTSLTEAAVCLHEGVLAGGALSQRKGPQRKCPPPLSKMCKKVQARRRGAECWRERGYRRMRQESVCRFGSKNSKHPRPTHSLADTDGESATLWSENGWGLSPSPSPLRHPHETYSTKARNPTEDIMLQKVGPTAQEEAKPGQDQVSQLTLTPWVMTQFYYFVTWIITH